MLLSSSNRKYQSLSLLSYFFVVVCLRCLLHHILSLIAYTFRESRVFVFIIIVQFMMISNSRIRFSLQIVLVCLYSTPSHYQHCASLSEISTYKMPVRYILSSVWVTLSIFSQLSIIQYVGLCVISWPIPLVIIERIYMLCFIIIIKSEVWTITHCLGLGYKTMVCAVCLSISLWLDISHNIPNWQYNNKTNTVKPCTSLWVILWSLFVRVIIIIIIIHVAAMLSHILQPISDQLTNLPVCI